jgi:molybdopterin synthase catalytic subunit
MIGLSSDPIDPAALLAEFTHAAAGCGAIVSFTGLVREDDSVSALWLDHHERFTVAAIDALASELRQRFTLEYLVIVHRIGSLSPGDPILFVAAAAIHRRAAFDAVDLAMDRLKTAVPLWKRETRADGVHWIEARAQDHADAARWGREHG